MNEQLPLGLQLRASAHFSNFIPAAHTELVDQVQRIAAGGPPRQLYCWGAAGSGKTHTITVFLSVLHTFPLMLPRLIFM